ncbi:hypothetical protein OPV22_015712 [Ensete ventricosum]|uniref:Uncharacterized protein n=1 Tax=Ensete ventricosum TaxID=4639 RepID=A0AAV8RA35_ENSVE|nr:hypothetical protein OPV22_015712 [Ensete ventricosum]
MKAGVRNVLLLYGILRLLSDRVRTPTASDSICSLAASGRVTESAGNFPAPPKSSFSFRPHTSSRFSPSSPLGWLQAIEKRIAVFSLKFLLKMESAFKYHGRANCEEQIHMKEFRRGWQLKSLLKPKLYIKSAEQQYNALCNIKPNAGSRECTCGGNMVKGICVKPIQEDAVVFRNMVSHLSFFFNAIYALHLQNFAFK